ncbi:hypothetical protein J2Z18_003741 [Paenibacillus lactis]|uniref:Uncharacterized protein n=1 Tax=Paenibacillus lactis TaxID=228574 RepID=A0ABS4FEF9_9BACL|nr:hypothetical protein [Paenibacillus lactis]
MRHAAEAQQDRVDGGFEKGGSAQAPSKALVALIEWPKRVRIKAGLCDKSLLGTCLLLRRWIGRDKSLLGTCLLLWRWIGRDKSLLGTCLLLQRWIGHNKSL